MTIKESSLQGVFEEHGARRKRLYTKNLTPGKRVYDENLVRKGPIEYREWNPRKSKLAAAIMNGTSQIGLRAGRSVLYLGASTGTTVSHVSDIVENGCVFAVESAPRMMRDLVFVCEQRKNVAPILGDAGQPATYAGCCLPVDCVYQDIAQRNQVGIFLANVDAFLKKGGFGLLAVKARSIDVAARPRDIYRRVRTALEEHRGITIVDYRELEPFEHDHCLFVVKKK